MSQQGALEARLGQLLAERLGARALRVSSPHRNRVKVEVKQEHLKEAAALLKELGFDHLHMITGTDYPKAGEIELTYVVGTVSSDEWRRAVVLLATRLNRAQPRAPSLVAIWPGAEYHEREQFEMLGISFEGHPDLRRLLLPEDWNDLPPLRKDFQLRKWHEEERAEHGLTLGEGEAKGGQG
ncbi:MAG: NADH-quinone oxidoreductase subunit C [Nitrososphaerota archaeon]